MVPFFPFQIFIPGKRNPLRGLLVLVAIGSVGVDSVLPSSAEAGATVTGKVVLKGPVPPAIEMGVTEDQAFCGKTLSITTVTTQKNGRGVVHAIVSLKNLEEGPAPTPHVQALHNTRCAFDQRVNALRLGDKLEVQNLDPILHNAHGKFGTRTILNVAQVPGGRPFQKKMKYPGHLSITCDKHTFMQAHVLVFPHSYFSMTNEQGRFRIEEVPEGLQHITVWHETLGTLEKEITVPHQGTVTVDFVFP